MKKTMLASLFIILAFSVLSTGCARKSHSQREVSALQAQVGVLTEEVIRLDDALQSTRAALQSEEDRRNQAISQLNSSDSRINSLRQEESVIRSIYRTPSGFELPSVSIQKALKSAGYYDGALDGKIGPGTRKAIKAFQKDNGLTADGIVGRSTWNKLQVYTNPVK